MGKLSEIKQKLKDIFLKREIAKEEYDRAAKQYKKIDAELTAYQNRTHDLWNQVHIAQQMIVEYENERKRELQRAREELNSKKKQYDKELKAVQDRLEKHKNRKQEQHQRVVEKIQKDIDEFNRQRVNIESFKDVTEKIIAKRCNILKPMMPVAVLDENTQSYDILRL